MEFFLVFLYSKTFSSTRDKFNFFLIRIAKNIIARSSEKLIVSECFLSAVFKTSSTLYFFPSLGRYSAVPFWKYISFVITLKQPYIYQNLWSYVWGCFDRSDASGIPNLLLFKKAMSFFPCLLIKWSRVLVLLIFSGGYCVGLFHLEPHLTQYLSRSPSPSPHEGQKHEALPSILNWLGVLSWRIFRMKLRFLGWILDF